MCCSSTIMETSCIWARSSRESVIHKHSGVCKAWFDQNGPKHKKICEKSPLSKAADFCFVENTLHKCRSVSCSCVDAMHTHTRTHVYKETLNHAVPLLLAAPLPHKPFIPNILLAPPSVLRLLPPLLRIHRHNQPTSTSCPDNWLSTGLDYFARSPHAHICNHPPPLCVVKQVCACRFLV